MARREYKGAAPETTLSSGILAAATSFNVADGTGYPTGAVGPFFVVIDPGTASEEKILCTSRTGNAFSCAGGRGADDTIAVDHAAPAKVRHVFTKTDADEANAHVNATTGVHGKTSALASLSDVETLTNKTMSGGSNTFTALPQSAVTALVSDLAAKVAKADVHDSWETAFLLALGAGWSDLFGVTPGTGWSAAIDVNLDPDAASLLANIANSWVAPLQAALGANWPTAFAAALDADALTVLGAMGTGWPASLAAAISGLRPTQDFEPANDTTTSTSYVPGTTNGVAFTGPPSGFVIVTAEASLGTNHGTIANGSYLSFHIRNGAVVGSGTDVLAGHDDRSARMTSHSTDSGFKYSPASVRRVITGLTPGNSYNVVSVFRTTSAAGGGAAAVLDRNIMVEPVL